MRLRRSRLKKIFFRGIHFHYKHPSTTSIRIIFHTHFPETALFRATKIISSGFTKISPVTDLFSLLLIICRPANPLQLPWTISFHLDLWYGLFQSHHPRENQGPIILLTRPSRWDSPMIFNFSWSWKS